MDWAFDYMQRHGNAIESERRWLRDETGGSVWLRLSSRRRKQPKLRESAEFCQGVIDDTYWRREPGPGRDLVIADQGTDATEAISATGVNGQDQRGVGVLNVTSSDRVNAGWQAAKCACTRRRRFAKSQIERLLARLPHHTRIITAIDGRPATLSRLGDVRGHIVASLGVERFGQSGTETDLCRHDGLRGSIAATAQMVSPAPPCGWQPSAESMSAARPRELIFGGPDGLPGNAMPCLCDEFSGEVAAPQFADRSHVRAEPDFNEGSNPGFASGLSEN